MPLQRTIRTLLLSISVLSMAACSSEPVDTTKTAAPMPPIAEMDMAMNKPAPLSQSDTLTPVLPQAETVATTTTTTTVTPPSSIEERMAKLEQSVDVLKSEYGKMAPAFTSLNTTNERIQTLLDELENQTGKTPVSTPAHAPAAAKSAMSAPDPVLKPMASSAPVAMAEQQPRVKTTEVTEITTRRPAVSVRPDSVMPAMNAPAAAPPAAATAAPATSNAVKAVRIGEHGTKTRLVFDMASSTKPDFKYDLDNKEHLLLIGMPSSVWGGATSGKPNSPMIEGWTVTKDAAGGSILAIQLKKDARILSTEFLKPEGKDSARLVLDIAPGI